MEAGEVSFLSLWCIKENQWLRDFAALGKEDGLSALHSLRIKLFEFKHNLEERKKVWVCQKRRMFLSLFGV